MKKLLLTLTLTLLASLANATDKIVPPFATEVVASTSTYTPLLVTSSTISSCGPMTLGVYRIVTNHSLYTIYMVSVSTFTAAQIAAQGTPIYSHEHYVDDRWQGSMYFIADTAAGANTCDTRIETKNRFKY